MLNTASRLEGFDKGLMDEDMAADGCRILVGGTTFEMLDGTTRTRYIGDMPLAGRAEKVRIYGVLN